MLKLGFERLYGFAGGDAVFSMLFLECKIFHEPFLFKLIIFTFCLRFLLKCPPLQIPVVSVQVRYLKGGNVATNNTLALSSSISLSRSIRSWWSCSVGSCEYCIDSPGAEPLAAGQLLVILLLFFK